MRGLVTVFPVGQGKMGSGMWDGDSHCVRHVFAHGLIIDSVYDSDWCSVSVPGDPMIGRD